MAGTAPNLANRTMWTRDNLDVLRGLNSESIDLVYADPPFNSNKNYEAPIGSPAAGAAFKDTWALSDVDLAWHDEIAEREPKVYAAIRQRRHRARLRHEELPHYDGREAARAATGAEAERSAVAALRPDRGRVPANAARRDLRRVELPERDRVEADVFRSPGGLERSLRSTTW